MLLVVSMILSSVRFDYIGDVFAADAGATSETGEVTISTPGEAEKSEAILEGEEAADKNQTELVVDEERENEEESENVEEVVDDSAKVLVVDDPSIDYSITINAPEGSLPYPEEELSVTSREILPGTDAYDMYLGCAADALNQDGTESISFARFFDIEILRNGEKIEPELPVEVKIEYDNAPEVSNSEDLNIVHFANDGIEVIDDVNLSSDASVITYDQDSFSVTATIVTDKTPPEPSDNLNRPLAWKTYALVAKYNNEYYTVEYDGSLKKVTNNGDVSITSDSISVWIFANEDGKSYLRYIAEGYDYNKDDLPMTNGYTYIDPTVDNGLSTDVVDHVEPKVGASEKPFYTTVFESPKDHCAITFDSNGYIKTGDNDYLSVESSGEGLKIKGNSSYGSATEFVLAEVKNLPDFSTCKEDILGGYFEYGPTMAWNNQVNHIDISIEDSVTATIPLIYGTYYYKDSNDEWQKLVVDKDNPKSITVKQDLHVTQETMRNATIKAYKKDGSELDDAFVIMGYSSNSADNNANTVQVRIEGVFKVSTATLVTSTENEPYNSEENGRLRKENKVTYSIYAIQPDVEFDYDSVEYGQLYDINKKPLSITTDVQLKKEKFGYFEDDNTCPPIKNFYHDPWSKGSILRTGTSGMDFTIEGTTDIQLKLKPVAINVYNDLRDSSGNIIKPAEEYNDIKFNVKQDYDGKPSDVAGKNVSNYSDSIDVSGYTDNSHKIDSVIDKTGSGLVYDYNVFPGMVNVEEDINTVPKIVVDQDGNTWFYRYSYIETEYVNREDGNERKLHVGDQYQSNDETAVATPEVLGDHKDVNNGNKFSEFVEFFAHNVYDKVIPPTKEEVSPYQGNGELGGVCAGDQITYSINYTNYSSSAEDIVIKDKLDENVEFVSASNGGTESDGVVTWNLDSVPAGQKGSVTLTVKVLETALESNGGPGTVINGGDTATVQVGNDPVFKLDEVLNPVTMPSKMEVSPYEGNGLLGNVAVGEEIVYEITYKNYKDSAATVVIKDLLDKNVEFVSATNGGVNNNGTVVWTLKDVPAGQIGTVNLTVKVLEGALASNGGPGSVINGGMGDPSHGGISNKYGATVQVGDDKEVGLDQVENPVVLEPFKQEVAPYAGTGKLGEVNVGDEITYEIVYTNYKNKPVDVTIADLFDKNLKFISASDGGEYDAEEHGVSWEIKDVPAGKTGKVTVTVKVLEGALKSKNGPGNVINGGFEEPESNYSFTLVVIDDDLFILDPVENPVKEPAATVTTPAKTAAPAKTGDKMPILPVAGIMIIAVVGIVIIARKRRKIND